MTASGDSSEISSPRFGSLSTAGKVRLVAFTIVVLALIALNLVMTPSYLLAAPVAGWIQNLGAHQIHDMTIGALVWLGFVVPMALHLYRPAGRVNTVLPPLVAAVSIAVMAFLANSFLFTGFVVMSVLVVIAIVLHPAGRSLARFDRVESVDLRVAGLFAIGAVPLLVYAGLELAKQGGPVDEHVVFVHFGGMAVAAFLVVLMGSLAVLRRRDWRFAAWIAGLMAGFIGLGSIVYPSVPSSLGPFGGAALFLWAAAFLITIEYVRRVADTETASRDETVADAV